MSRAEKIKEFEAELAKLEKEKAEDPGFLTRFWGDGSSVKSMRDYTLSNIIAELESGRPQLQKYNDDILEMSPEQKERVKQLENRIADFRARADEWDKKGYPVNAKDLRNKADIMENVDLVEMNDIYKNGQAVVKEMGPKRKRAYEAAKADVERWNKYLENPPKTAWEMADAFRSFMQPKSPITTTFLTQAARRYEQDTDKKINGVKRTLEILNDLNNVTSWDSPEEIAARRERQMARIVGLRSARIAQQLIADAKAQAGENGSAVISSADPEINEMIKKYNNGSLEVYGQETNTDQGTQPNTLSNTLQSLQSQGFQQLSGTPMEQGTTPQGLNLRGATQQVVQPVVQPVVPPPSSQPGASAVTGTGVGAVSPITQKTAAPAGKTNLRGITMSMLPSRTPSPVQTSSPAQYSSMLSAGASIGSSPVTFSGLRENRLKSRYNLLS